jgi:CHAT domain-containing protein
MTPADAYKSAEASFERGNLKDALAFVDGAGSSKNPELLWHLRLLKAEIYIWQGRNKDALGLLGAGGLPETKNPALPARRSTLEGIAQGNLQQLQLADQTFQATARMPGANSPEVKGDLLIGEGKLAAFRHDPSNAFKLFNLARQTAQENDQPFLASKALGNLGVLQMQQRQYADAVDSFNASLAAAQKVDAQTSIVRTTFNLGWAYRRMGDIERASELFDQSEKKASQLGLLVEETDSVASLATIRFLQHDFAAAEKDYQQALDLARRRADTNEVVFCLIDLAQNEIELGMTDMAEKHNNEALHMEGLANDESTELYCEVNQAQIYAIRGNNEAAVALLKGVLRTPNVDVGVRVAALRILAKIDVQLNHVQSAKEHYRDALEARERERKSLGNSELKLSYPSNTKDTEADYVGFLVAQHAPDEAFRIAELEKARALTDAISFKNSDTRAFDVAEVQKAATRLGHPILTYWIGANSSYVWIVLPNQTKIFTLPDEEKLRSLVERYRAHLGGVLPGTSLGDPDGQELYRILIGPVEQWIQPQSQVTIICDGPLCGLNFETLLVNKPVPHYWIEDVSITNASSAFLLALGNGSKPVRPVPPEKSLLLIGNPDYPPNYPPLSHAAEEMRLVGGHFGQEQETVLSGKEATPAAYFKAKPEEYGLIHFVAHGTASRMSPLDSAVVLSQDGASYNLYARDIAASPLHADLVTISACDSAGTRIYSSEGLVGLSWAFLRAGARRVIASLWEANDASTPKLMDQLYSGMAAGKDPAAALRDAKLTLVRSKGVYSRPFYWAAFVLYQGV